MNPGASGREAALEAEVAGLRAALAVEGVAGRIADQLPSGMIYQVRARPDGTELRFVHVSAGCERLTGVPAAVALADPEALYGRIIPEDRAAMARSAAAAREAMRPFEAEARMLHGRTGLLRRMRFSSAPRVAAPGWLAWDGLMVDVTTDRQAEESLRESEALKAAVLESALDCIVTIDGAGRVVEWNPASERVFGWSRAAAMGQELAGMIIPLVHHAAHRAGMARFMATGVSTMLGRRIEVEARRADGSLFPAELAITPTAVDGRHRFTAYLRDVTERRAAERRQGMLLAELTHRVKNMLATVQAVADQTLRHSAGEGTGFGPPFLARLGALARAHDLLTEGGWGCADLAHVLRAALRPWMGEEGRVRLLEGASARVSPRQAQALVMAAHELATNAVRHGALARPGGWVEVGVSREPCGALALAWEERGGPAVRAPSRRGFGTRLLEGGLARELGAGASVTLGFEAAGLRGAIRFVPEAAGAAA